MKKFFIAAALLLTLVPASALLAKGYGKARAGILLGGTSSSATIKNLDVKSISVFQAGLTAQLPLGMGFSVQPSLLYQTKGMSIGEMKGISVSDIAGSLETRVGKTKVGYLELPVQVQWGPDLMLFHPYLLAEPFIGYQLGSGSSDLAKTFESELKKLEYGLGVGAGIDVWRLQVSGRYFWNFGNIYKNSGKAVETIKQLKDGNNFNGFTISVALFF